MIYDIRFKNTVLVTLLIIGLNGAGIFAIGETIAYFVDTETASGNSFGAGSLDFSLTDTEVDEWIGKGEDISFESILTNAGSLGWQYMVEAEEVSGEEAFCGALLLEAELNGVEKHDGALLDFDVPAATTLGTWGFEITLPGDAAGIGHGDTCEVDLVFRGWQAGVPLYEESGFTDEERISLLLTARMVVLNEFLPNPEGFEYGFDFGTDFSDMPQGEWVELYNNGSSGHDLTGWYVWDASGSEANKIAITAANTDPATTIIGAGDWLVVYMNKPVFNNTGDTVKLYDDTGALIDEHAYTDNDYCDLEPTPGGENETTTMGSCGGVPPNKSYARIPDGIGGWVDPIPTPGGVNLLEEIEEDNFQFPAPNAQSISGEVEEETEEAASTTTPGVLGEGEGTTTSTDEGVESLGELAEEVACLPVAEGGQCGIEDQLFILDSDSDEEVVAADEAEDEQGNNNGNNEEVAEEATSEDKPILEEDVEEGENNDAPNSSEQSINEEENEHIEE